MVKKKPQTDEERKREALKKVVQRSSTEGMAGAVEIKHDGQLADEVLPNPPPLKKKPED